jgi:hypothetical protein
MKSNLNVPYHLKKLTDLFHKGNLKSYRLYAFMLGVDPKCKAIDEPCH